MRLSVLLLAALPSALPAQGLNRPFLGALGQLTAFDVTPDMVPEGRWDWGAIPGYGMLAARPLAMNGALADAVVVITCLEGRGGPELNVYVNYWIAEEGASADEPTALDVVTGALAGDLNALSGHDYDPDDVYTIDLFNSMLSGRPASYDLGEGEVPTTGISFSYNEVPPMAYLDATTAFLRAALDAGEDGRMTLRFLPRRDLTAEAKMRLPMDGFAEAWVEVEARSYVCPRL